MTCCVELAVDHFLAGGLDGGELGLVPAAQFVVGPGGGQLDRAEGMDQPRWTGRPAKGKFSSARSVWMPHSASAGTSRLPSRSVSWRKSVIGTGIGVCVRDEG